MKREEKQPRAASVSWLGRFMNRLPKWKLLYPLYLPTQLDTVEAYHTFPGLPPAFEGLTLGYVSDIHYGSLFSRERVQALTDRINALQSDVLILGGDFGENTETALEFFEHLPSLQAKEAILAVLGNHDRTAPDLHSALISAMERAGVIPLVNQAWALKKQGARMIFAGPDDYFNGMPDLPLLRTACRNADFTVFLPHNPDLLPLSLDNSGQAFYQLALCGHTHGGQVAVLGHSIIPSAETGDRYRSGWYREGGAEILVSNGVGVSRLPVRLGARPQIHKLTLLAEKGGRSS